MLESLHHIVTDLSPWLHQYGYVILALAIAVEGFGIPAPGQSLLIVAAILAASGQMSLPLVIIVAAISAFSGNCIGYYLGLRFGNVLLNKGWIKPQTEQKLHQFIGQYGGLGLVISRFVEGLKQYLCLGCGIAKMPVKQFLLGNLFATSVWALVFGLGPAFLERESTPLLIFYHQHQIISWLIVSVLIGAIAVVLWRAKAAKPAN
ncbi:DedA family protein [Shewanella sp. NIFS-20-20]|uniref:DedA family protein n=1 Tax=Shewanella sp. NIFS-20-20 TaxID=2853806 RepID=UPI001C493A70|nr:DedA family protein [Shewanella sp. NIFS-20-20]MBV7315288.1 DedA family protein [Shewanella sp. NIFS-20-20]